MNPAERPWPQETGQSAVPYPPPAPAAAPSPMLRKRPLLAAILSFFPGLGQIYVGLYLRGAILFLVFASLMQLVDSAEAPIFALGIAFTVCFSVIDAYRQAVLINYGYARDLGLTDLPVRPRAGQGGIIAGVVLAILGILAAIERFFVVDLSLLADLWPFGLIAVGAWLIVATVRERRRDREGEPGT